MLPVFCQTVPVDSTNHETVSPQHISKRKKRIWVLIISVAAVILFCFCLRFFYTPTKEMVAVNIFGGVKSLYFISSKRSHFTLSRRFLSRSPP